MNHETELKIIITTGLNIQRFVLCLVEIKNYMTEKKPSSLLKIVPILDGQYDDVEISEETVKEHLSDLENAIKLYESFVVKDGFFIHTIQASEIHWHFENANAALKKGFYLSAVITYCAAIENSIRSTIMKQKIKANPSLDLTLLQNEIENVPLLFDSLVQGKKKGMPIDVLSFPGEPNVSQTLNDKINQVSKVNPQIVNLRNCVCHGNLYNFFQDIGMNSTTDIIFTPEMLVEQAFLLSKISKRWIEELASFRKSSGIF